MTLGHLQRCLVVDNSPKFRHDASKKSAKSWDYDGLCQHPWKEITMQKWNVHAPNDDDSLLKSGLLLLFAPVTWMLQLRIHLLFKCACLSIGS